MFKRLFCWAYFQGSICSEGLIIGGNLAFQNQLDGNSLEQLKHITLTVHGLIFGKADYWKDIYVQDLRGLFSGGLIFEGAYYRNFMVFPL